ncbi:hypothetical protein RS030_91531 [Cryptosporidium xiaoi]|uniref:Peptidase S9 prolyl oligopeptidase catalytic domain-containing protein n=1 Tax=Cryptosporidium xiaoi TaxID=659607 RepID=A0AAV9XTQ7_9CRYT
MELFSENSKYISDLKTLTREADHIIQQHQQLVELDLNLNINRESLSAIRRGCYQSLSYTNDSKDLHCNLEDIRFSKFDTTNKLLRLGDFFISTTPYIIHKYLLSEKKALEELIYIVRANRHKKLNEFLELYPNIPDEYLNDIRFIIKDTKSDKLHKDNKTENTIKLSNKYNTSLINFIPKFSIFEQDTDSNIEYSAKRENSSSVQHSTKHLKEFYFNSSSYCFYGDLFPSGNFKGERGNVLLFLYNHGFPDYTIRYENDKEKCLSEYKYKFDADNGVVENYYVQELNFEENGVKLTRFPSKMRDMCLSNIGDCISNVYHTIFITFNTNGILGSVCGDFYDKTLVKDMNDIETVTNYFCNFIYNKSKLIMIGLSTGAFLTFSYSTNYTKRGNNCNINCSNNCFKCEYCRSSYFISNSNLIGIVCIACVDDIPSSYNLDFNSNQLSEFNSMGYCIVDSNVPFISGNKLSSSYLKSYDCFPSYNHLYKNRNRIINVPTLLVHGTDDANVPFNMSVNLLRLNNHDSDCESSENEEPHLTCSENYTLEFNKDLLDSLVLRINNHGNKGFTGNRLQKGNKIKLHVIEKGNHLITNTKHMKKAQKAISLFVFQILNDVL